MRPIPVAASPYITYDTTGANLGETVQTPAGDDNGFHAIIGSITAQMPTLNPPTLDELRGIARGLGFAPPYGDKELVAVLEAWGATKGLSLGLGVKKWMSGEKRDSIFGLLVSNIRNAEDLLGIN